MVSSTLIMSYYCSTAQSARIQMGRIIHHAVFPSVFLVYICFPRTHYMLYSFGWEGLVLYLYKPLGTQVRRTNRELNNIYMLVVIINDIVEFV